MSRFWMRTVVARLVAVITLVGIAVAGMTPATQQAGKAAAAPKYIGSAKCKNCHADATTGDQYGKWKEEKHAKAFASLASPDALKFGKAKGVDEPQKSDKCLKCHTTAFGEPADRIVKGFVASDGVQCESCHGPGELHMKARMAGAGAEGDKAGPQTLPAGEIIGRPPLKQCLTCHNDESPTFKPFCYKKRLADISHDDPRKKRTKEEIDAMKCGCGDPCKCTKGECGEPASGH